MKDDLMSRTSKVTVFSLALLVAGCASLQPRGPAVEVPYRLRVGAN
jgi:hypothetical protein